MAIAYDKLFKVLDEEGITATVNRKRGLIAQGTLTRLRRGEGGIDNRTLDKVCRELNRQPGDLYEYVPDDKTSEYQYVWTAKAPEH